MNELEILREFYETVRELDRTEDCTGDFSKKTGQALDATREKLDTQWRITWREERGA